MVKTRAGHVGFVVSPRGLRRIFLPMPARSHIEADIHKAHPTATADDRLMPELAAQLEQYFEGREVRFSARLDLS